MLSSSLVFPTSNTSNGSRQAAHFQSELRPVAVRSQQSILASKQSLFEVHRQGCAWGRVNAWRCRCYVYTVYCAYLLICDSERWTTSRTPVQYGCRLPHAWLRTEESCCTNGFRVGSTPCDGAHLRHKSLSRKEPNRIIRYHQKRPPSVRIRLSTFHRSRSNRWPPTSNH